MDRIARESAIWKLLHQLPEEVFVNITMLLLLTPEETAHSLACVFRAKVATDSGRTLPPIPGEGCH
jgi:hypothetical protein